MKHFNSKYYFLILLPLFFIHLQGCSPQCRQNFVERASAIFKSGDCPAQSPSNELVIDPPVVTISYSASFPTSSQNYWLSDQSSNRTVTLTHDADSIECSRDNGSTYGSCNTSTTLIWNVADYSVNHKVRFTKASAESVVYTFKPSDQFSNIEFLTCTETVSSNENFSTFASRLSTGSKVICIDNGVQISRPAATADNQITFGANDITILAKTKSQAEFINNNNSAGTTDQRSFFDIIGRTNIKIYGIKFTSNDGGSSYAVQAQSASQNVVVNNCEFVNAVTTGTFYGVKVSGSGATQAIQVKNSVFSLAGNGHYALSAATNSVVQFSSNVVSSLYRGIYSQFTSQVTSSSNTYNITSANGIAFDIFQSSLTSSGDTINDSVGLGIVILNNGGSPGSTTTYVTDGTTYKRKNALTSNSSSPVIKINNGTGTYVVNSSTNNNLACNESTTAVSYGSYISGTASGTFSANSQLNGNPATFANCP